MVLQSYVRNSRGIEIFSKSWLPENSRIKALVCFCHGYGDTCTFFFEGIYSTNVARDANGADSGAGGVPHLPPHFLVGLVRIRGGLNFILLFALLFTAPFRPDLGGSRFLAN